MDDIRRLGGWSAILSGVALLAATVFAVPIYAAMPAEAMQPGNRAELLMAVGAMGPAQRTSLAVVFGSFFLAGLFMAPAFVAVFGVTRARSEGRAALALGMAILGTALFVMGRSAGPALLRLSDGIADAEQAVQAARVASYGVAEWFALDLERGFWFFFLWSTVLWLGLMREQPFPRWLRWVGLATAILGVVGGVAGLVVPALESTLAVAGLVLIVWLIGLGAALLRSGRRPG